MAKIKAGMKKAHDVIWKYPVKWRASNPFHLEMPAYCRILDVQFQKSANMLCEGEAKIWVLAKTDAKQVLRTFVVMATGEEFDGDNKIYIGTWQEGSYVWHLFEALGGKA